MMSKRIRDTTPDVIAAARRLRQQPTLAERILWKELSNRQLNGLKFRFQHPVSSFIADFYCPEHRLIIELDGAIHNQQTDYDQAHTEKLQQLSYRILRFRNPEITQNLAEVLQKILSATQSPP
jgi:very-short-patch-repair endonuclease